MGKIRARIDLSVFGDDFGDDKRALCVTIETENDETLEKIIDSFEEKARDTDVKVEFVRCPFEDENMIGDAFYIDFEYGFMNDTRREIRKIWKEIKKELNLR